MSNVLSIKRSPRVLFFGMRGNFSPPSLAALLESGIEVCAVIMPASPLPGSHPPAIQRKVQARALRTSLPLLKTPSRASIVQMAWEQQIPVWEVHRLASAETVATLAAYEPDVICVACFSLRIPRAVRDLPRLGCLNVHPSLLPANRGPVPLFWTFREGHEMTGVTIHCINEGIDSGDILAQESIEVPDGVSYDQLEMRCAVRGGALLAHTVWDFDAQRAVCVPQNETKSSYHAFPSDEDMTVCAETWSARHIYNFVRGIGHWSGPVRLRVGTEMLLICDSTSYGYKVRASAGNEEAIVRCKDGWVNVSMAAEEE